MDFHSIQWYFIQFNGYFIQFNAYILFNSIQFNGYLIQFNAHIHFNAYIQLYDLETSFRIVCGVPQRIREGEGLCEKQRISCKERDTDNGIREWVIQLKRLTDLFKLCVGRSKVYLPLGSDRFEQCGNTFDRSRSPQRTVQARK